VNGSPLTPGTATLVGNETPATATLTPVVPLGPYVVTPKYSGNTTYLPGTGVPINVVVEPIVGPVAASGDLDIVDSSGATVAEAAEESPGGWVAVNNDNDNYNFVGNQATGTQHVFDKDETAKVDGENDLVKVTVRDLVPENNNPYSGKFTLSWTSAKIKVWNSATKGAVPFTNGDVLAVGASYTLWVEGLALSGGVAAEELKLNWVKTAGGASEVDKVAFTVYEVQGVMNVPGYSVHTYKLTSPSTSILPLVLSVTDGTKKTESVAGVSGRSVLQTSVLWGASAVVGKVRLSPGLAAGNFWTDRE
jgi:hypothetical protein